MGRKGTKKLLSTGVVDGKLKAPSLAKPLTTTPIHRIADLADFREPWRQLAAGAPMQSPEWLFTWLQYYTAPEDELCVLLFHEPKGSLVGVAPLYIQKAGGSATVRLLGSGDACTNHTTWLAAPGRETQIGHEVARFLLEHKSDWDSLHLEWIDDGDAAITTTVDYLEKNGCFLRRWPLANCWEIALPPTWDDYLKMLSRKHRKQCRRLLKKYFDSGRVQTRKVRSEKELQEGFKILLQLHGARWGDRKNPKGVFSDRKFRSFHETVARKLLKRQQLNLVWLEYDGTPISAEYQFIDENTVYAYQAGMDPSFIELRPGQLSILTSIRSAIEQGRQSFDLSRGNEPYKAHYRATPRACHDLFVWPDRFAGRLGYSLGYSMMRMRYYAKVGRYLAAQWLQKGMEFRNNN